jgi:farnesyl diphosphate synthase
MVHCADWRFYAQHVHGFIVSDVGVMKELSAGTMLDPASSASFAARLDAIARDVENLLDRLLASGGEHIEITRPRRLLDAMRYGSLGGGKRLRPFLVVESASLFGVPLGNGLMAGAALECIHCYSLIHDDLPAMDNDDLRRGRPTVHRAFDDATAILAGDGLLTFAFDLLSRPETSADPGIRVELVKMLSRAAGIGGMVGGQMLDLAAEGRFAQGASNKLTERDVAVLQAMKTGALLRFACNAGAILGQASDNEAAALDRFGDAIGQAFQIADDLLDMEGDSVVVGKATGKDAAAGKATMVSILGVAGAKARLQELVAGAEDALARFGTAGTTLVTAARFIADRRS